MKKSLIVILLTNYCVGQAKKIVRDSAKFSKYLTENSTSFTFDGQKPYGEGWTILEKQFADNQFVAWENIIIHRCFRNYQSTRLKQHLNTDLKTGV